jgi:NCAIR mutase (PurE)-related protein
MVVIAVVGAGTGDMPVAEVTAELVDAIQYIGVAEIHHLMHNRERLAGRQHSTAWRRSPASSTVTPAT